MFNPFDIGDWIERGGKAVDHIGKSTVEIIATSLRGKYSQHPGESDQAYEARLKFLAEQELKVQEAKKAKEHERTERLKSKNEVKLEIHRIKAEGKVETKKQKTLERQQKEQEKTKRQQLKAEEKAERKQQRDLKRQQKKQEKGV